MIEFTCGCGQKIRVNDESSDDAHAVGLWIHHNHTYDGQSRWIHPSLVPPAASIGVTSPSLPPLPIALAERRIRRRGLRWAGLIAGLSILIGGGLYYMVAVPTGNEERKYTQWLDSLVALDEAHQGLADTRAAQDALPRLRQLAEQAKAATEAVQTLSPRKRDALNKKHKEQLQQYGHSKRQLFDGFLMNRQPAVLVQLGYRNGGQTDFLVDAEGDTPDVIEFRPSERTTATKP